MNSGSADLSQDADRSKLAQAGRGRYESHDRCSVSEDAASAGMTMVTFCERLALALTRVWDADQNKLAGRCGNASSDRGCRATSVSDDAASAGLWAACRGASVRPGLL